jgi:hypothetical protein
LIIVTLVCLATDTRGQSLDGILNNAEKATLDLVALHMAQKIQKSRTGRSEARASGHRFLSRFSR